MIIENYQEISSPQNSQIKLLESLDSKKQRQESGLFIVENLAIIYDAMRDGYDFEALFVTEEFANKHQDKLDYLQDASGTDNFYLIDAKLNKLYSSLDTPSGISAIYKMRDKKLDSTSVIYLNGINDPGNLGTIMRSALAFGFINLVLDGTCVDAYNSKTISAAKDAIFKLNIVEDKSGEWLKANKLPVYATSSHLGVDLSNFKAEKNFCLVLGGESHGVDQQILESAAQNIKIEMSSKIESLNVATAAAILLYELRNN
jgi:TrmH family RNA methyltransferase